MGFRSIRWIRQERHALGDPIYGDLAKLIEISIQGKKFKVPENNTCLRAFQYLSPETVSYGRFCWNQECHTCRVAYKMGDEPNSTPRSVLACKTLVAEGMEITELSEELKWVLTDVLRSAQPLHPRPDLDDLATPEPQDPSPEGRG